MNKTICGVLVATLLSSVAFGQDNEPQASGIAVRSGVIVSPDGSNHEVEGGLYFDHQSVMIISHSIEEMMKRDEACKRMLASPPPEKASPVVIAGVALSGVAVGVVLTLLLPKLVQH